MLNSIKLVLMSMVIITKMTAPASASRLDDLVSTLGGSDEKARTSARQWLAREDPVETVTRVLPLLSNEKESVWTAAFNVIADAESKVGQAGYEKQRTAVTDKVMSLLAQDQPEVIKLRAMRLLPRVIPDDYDVAPLAALLDDEKLQENALAALEETHTARAAAAVRRQLDKATPAFQAALLNSLAQLKDSASVSACEAMLKSQDANVRAAAIRAIAWTGQWAPVLDMLKAADSSTQSDTLDAVLRLIISVAEKGTDTKPAIDAYLGMLDDADPRTQQAALAGLARFGDANCIPRMIAAIEKADARTWSIGVQAVGLIPGSDSVRVIVEAYPRLSEKTRLALLPILGDSHDAQATAILKEAATSADATFRLAGLQAVADAALPDAPDLLTKAAAEGGPEQKAVAQRGLLKLADTLRKNGKRNEAGRIYARAFGVASGDKHILQSVTEGLTQSPVAEGYEAAKAIAANPDSGDTGTKLLLAVAGSLSGAGQKDKAVELFNLVRGRRPSLEVMQEVARGLNAAGAPIDLAGLLGTITQWWVVGPFELGENNAGWGVDYIGEANVSVAGRYMSGKRRVAWTQVKSTETNGKIDLLKNIANQTECLGYAFTEIIVPQAVDAVLLLGVDDSEKVWINGKQVFDQFLARGMSCDQDKILIKLKAGSNTILLKIWQHTLGWEFCARLATLDGRPLSFTQPKQ